MHKLEEQECELTQQVQETLMRLKKYDDQLFQQQLQLNQHMLTNKSSISTQNGQGTKNRNCGKGLSKTNASKANASHRTAPHRTAPHRTAPHSTAQHSTAQHRRAPHRTHRTRTAQRSTTPHRAPHRSAPHRSAQHFY